MDLWQRRSEEVLGQPLFSILSEVKEQELKRLLTEAFQSGASCKVTDRRAQFLRNGTLDTAWFDVAYQPVCNDAGDVYGVLMVSTEVTGKVLAGRQVEEQSQFSYAVLESSPNGVKVLDREGRLRYMNHDGLCLMELDEFCVVDGKSWWELWPEESRTMVKESVQHALAGEPVQFQWFCPTGKGTPKWWDVRVSPLRNISSEITQLVSVSRDITATKNAEAALLGRNRQLDLLARTAQHLIMHPASEDELLQTVFDDVCRTQELEIFFNYRPDPVAGTLKLQTSGGLLAQEKSLFAAMQFGENLCGRIAQHQELLVIENLPAANYPGSEAVRQAGIKAYAGFPLLSGGRLVGTVSFATRQRSHLADGEIRTVQAVCDQLAATIDRQQLNRELLESEQRFRTIFNHQFQFSALLTTAGTIIDLSESAVELSGRTREALIRTRYLDGPWFRDLPEARAVWEALIREAIGGAASSRKEAAFHAPDGTLRYAISAATGIPGSAGVVQYLLVEAMDISSRKGAEEALREQQRFTQSILEAAPSLTYVFDLRTRTNEFMAEQVMQVLGYSPAEIRAMGDRLLQPALSCRATRCPKEQAM